jgi:hypothetical protein
MSFRQFAPWVLQTMLMLAVPNSAVAGLGLADEPAVPAVNDAEMTLCLAKLASPVFADRQLAAETLKSATPEQITEIAAAVANHPDNEVVRRLIEILELRYGRTSLKSAATSVASEALEKAAESNRWFVSEAAKDVLQRHWQRRVELAVTELVRMNVSLSPTDPTILWKPDTNHDGGPFGMRDPTSNQHLKIYVDRNWPADPRAFELLKRLEPLRSDAFLTKPTLVSFYLIDGHPLTTEQFAVLKGLFGDFRIAERGRVCLGVLNDSRFGGELGVLVSSVQEGSSAADAGIRPGDLILGMNNEKIGSFEELVTLLRKYDVGDKITLQVRSRRGSEVPLNNVEVSLKGWQ